jgi:hypothetical protein
VGSKKNKNKNVHVLFCTCFFFFFPYFVILVFICVNYWTKNEKWQAGIASSHFENQQKAKQIHINHEKTRIRIFSTHVVDLFLFFFYDFLFKWLYFIVLLEEFVKSKMLISFVWLSFLSISFVLFLFHFRAAILNWFFPAQLAERLGARVRSTCTSFCSRGGSSL